MPQQSSHHLLSSLKEQHKIMFGTYPKGPKANDIEWLKSRVLQVQESSSTQKSESVEVITNSQCEENTEPKQEKSELQKLKDIHKEIYGTYPKGPKANDLAWLEIRISQKSFLSRKSEMTNSCEKESDADDVVPSEDCEENSACYSRNKTGSSCDDSENATTDNNENDDLYSVEHERASLNPSSKLNVLGQKLALKLIPNHIESEINEKQDSTTKDKNFLILNTVNVTHDEMGKLQHEMC
mmetsp:Transcript_24898/g.34750  ORF Transcript_24898/g.34750 Transcript_24898/m.34750 type:complete len:240 (+) Transcript_24898:45-764(+)